MARRGDPRARKRGLADVWLASPARPGAHGYLMFENPALPGNAQLVDGPALANLLTGTGVSLLTLNACRSARAEPAPGLRMAWAIRTRRSGRSGRWPRR